MTDVPTELLRTATVSCPMIAFVKPVCVALRGLPCAGARSSVYHWSTTRSSPRRSLGRVMIHLDSFPYYLNYWQVPDTTGDTQSLAPPNTKYPVTSTKYTGGPPKILGTDLHPVKFPFLSQPCSPTVGTRLSTFLTSYSRVIVCLIFPFILHLLDPPSY